MESSHMSAAIKQAYDAPGAAETYGRNTSLFKAEDVILSYLSDELRDKAILDVGVGAGRTVSHLRRLTSDYTGLDYSESMLKHCAATYTGTRLLLGDARSMDIFGDEAFDAVFCCWNMLDDVNHEDRCRILREIHRILRQKGLFIFSSHNLDFKIRSAYKFRGLISAENPVRLIKQNAIRIGRYLRGILNHLHNQRAEVHAADYSILNDSSHGYSLLTYYIKKQNQVRQLQGFGFEEIQMVNEGGSFITLDEECRDGWIYYVCRKAQLASPPFPANPGNQ